MSTDLPDKDFGFALRPISLGDADVLQRWFADAALAAALNITARKYSRDDVVKYILSLDQASSISVGIAERATGRLIGLSVSPYDSRHRVAHYGLMIADGYRNKRKYVEITALMFDHFFFERGVEKVATRTETRRAHGIRLIESFGMRREGVLIAEVLAPDGVRRIDFAIHAMLAPEWKAIRSGVRQKLLDSPRNNRID